MAFYDERQFKLDLWAARCGIVYRDDMARLQWRVKWPEDSSITQRLAFIGAMRERSWSGKPRPLSDRMNVGE